MVEGGEAAGSSPGASRSRWEVPVQIPLQVTFRGMESSPAVEQRIREHAEKLERFHPRITSCRVVVEAPHRQHHKGKLYTARIDVTYPGGEIAANREHRLDHSHEDVYVALRDVFSAVQRRLQDQQRIRRGRVKEHLAPQIGTIVRLFPDQGYGFAQLPDEQEVYFHRNAVAEGSFEALTVGTHLRLVINEGESGNGPQASTVVPYRHQLD